MMATEEELDTAWRAERRAWIESQEWYPAWLLFSLLEPPCNPQAAFAAGWQAARASRA